MTYNELKQIFQDLKHNSPREDLTAHIIFAENSFTKPYSLLSRTYKISSNNKAFWPNMGGYSIFGYCLDVTSDQGIRLDWCMADEGNIGGWKVDDCYILERMRDVEAVPYYTRREQEDGIVCYFFGETCIQVREFRENEKICLEPVSGNQNVCLPIDQVYGYCTLLERHLNKEARI